MAVRRYTRLLGGELVVGGLLAVAMRTEPDTLTDGAAITARPQSR